MPLSKHKSLLKSTGLERRKYVFQHVSIIMWYILVCHRGDLFNLIEDVDIDTCHTLGKIDIYRDVMPNIVYYRGYTQCIYTVVMKMTHSTFIHYRYCFQINYEKYASQWQTRKSRCRY